MGREALIALHKVTITYTFDELHILMNICIDKDDTQLSKVNQLDFMEALANITRKAVDNNRAQKETENLLNELNIQRDEDS